MAEINSSFHRPHRPGTYERWAATVPENFRFAVKLPREVTHTRRLVDSVEPLERFLAEAPGLGDKLGPLLVQLPPSLSYDAEVARAFFAGLRDRFSGEVACEPRHPTWFSPEADAALDAFRIARVAADPVRAPGAGDPGGWPGLAYWRLHGSPHVYRSGYTPEFLDTLALKLARRAEDGSPAWCIFDNTTLGAATADALGLLARVSSLP